MSANIARFYILNFGADGDGCRLISPFDRFSLTIDFNGVVSRMKMRYGIIVGCLMFLANSLWAEGQDFRVRENHLFRDYTAEDIKAEIRFGRNLAARILGKYKLLSNDESQRYVTLLGKGIAGQIGRAELTYYFAVIEMEDINAFACPGGYVFISSGAIKSMNDEAQLVGVIAHEIGHINRRHEVKSLKIRAKGDSVVSGIAAAIGSSSATARILLDQLTEKAFKILFEEGRSKEDEFEADSIGVEAMVTLGYDWRSYRSYLESLEGEIQRGVGKIVNKTHPSTRQRVNNINRLVEKLHLNTVNGKKNAKRFKKYHDKI